MENLEMWNLVIGFLLPLAIAVPQQAKWSDAVRATVAFGICALAAVGTCYFSDEFTGKALVTSALTILVAAISTYKMFWKPIGIAPKIEVATSPKEQEVDSLLSK